MRIKAPVSGTERRSDWYEADEASGNSECGHSRTRPGRTESEGLGRRLGPAEGAPECGVAGTRPVSLGKVFTGRGTGAGLKPRADVVILAGGGRQMKARRQQRQTS